MGNWDGSTISDVAAGSPKASPRNKPALSIRARLIVVALLALPLLTIERMRGLDQVRAEYAELATSLPRTRARPSKLITHVEAPCGLVTISIAVESVVPSQQQSAADLVEATDHPLYRTKRRGRNTVVAHISMYLSAAH